MFNANRSMNIHLACEFGSADRAIMFQQIQWACEYHRDRAEKYPDFFHDGNWWMKDTDEAWATWGPWRSKKSWSRDKKWLKDNGWIFVEQLRRSQWDQTCYIAINEEKLAALQQKLLNEKSAPDKVVNSDRDKVSQSGSSQDVSLDRDNVSHSSISNRSTSRSKTIESAGGTQNGISTKKKTRSSKPLPSENDKRLAELWREKHLAVNHPVKLREKCSDPVKLAKDFADIRKRKGLNDEQVNAVIETFLTDTSTWKSRSGDDIGWRDIIIMPLGLLRGKDGAHHIDRFIRRITRPLSVAIETDQAIAEGIRRAEKKLEDGDCGF